MVYLIRRNVKSKRLSDKLDFKKLGPFKVTKKVINVNYRLELLEGMKIHPVFYVALLILASRSIKPDIIVEIEEEKPEYKVDEVLNSRLASDEL